jgi:hypothetical protein
MVRNCNNVSICIWYEIVIMYRSAYGTVNGHLLYRSAYGTKCQWYEMVMVRNGNGTKWLWYENDFHYGTKWQVRNDCNSITRCYKSLLHYNFKLNFRTLQFILFLSLTITNWNLTLFINFLNLINIVNIYINTCFKDNTNLL